jgi:hypothetical protein
MKNGIGEIVGKTVSQVLVSEGGTGPTRQYVFLVFSDGTYFEFWGSAFNCAGGVDKGGMAAALQYAECVGSTVKATYPKPNA